MWSELEGLDTGGNAIDSYNLRWDQGNDDWTDLVGQDGNYILDTEHIQVDDVTAGTIYKIVVRAHNSHGWGEESDYLILTAAKGPEKPDAPETLIHNHFIKI